MIKYQILEADPAWTYACGSVRGAATNHYSTMDNNAIAALPVASVMDDNALLFLWATFPLLKEAIYVGESWGCTYVTCAFNWIKRNRTNSFFMGNGYYTRSNAEICLLFKRGKPPLPADKGISQIIAEGGTPNEYMGGLFTVMTARMSHSTKPETVYDCIERMYPDAKKLRLFARDQRDGWTSLGNEVTGNDIRIDLAKLASPAQRPVFWAGGA